MSQNGRVGLSSAATRNRHNYVIGTLFLIVAQGSQTNFVPDASGSAKAQPLRYLSRRATFCLLDFQNAALTFLWVSADHHMRHAHEPRPLTKQLLIVKLLHRGEGTAPQDGCGLHNLRSVASSSHLISKAASRRDASRSFRNHSRLIRG